MDISPARYENQMFLANGTPTAMEYCQRAATTMLTAYCFSEFFIV